MTKVLVRANDRVVRMGGSYFEYNQGVTIGADPVEVELSPMVSQWLARGEIVLVDPGDQKGDETGWPSDLKEDIVALLEENGFTPESVKSASDEELLAVKGLGRKTLEAIRSAFGE